MLISYARIISIPCCVLIVSITPVIAQPPACVPAADISLKSLAEQLQAQRLALAIFQLEIAIRTYKPFIQELSLVQKLGVNESRLRIPIDNLLPHAATGVATINELRDSFGIILLPKLEALSVTPESSWGSQVWSWFAMVVAPSWQATKSSSTATELRQDLVRSAMNRLSEDNLRGALDELTQLDGPGAALTARWITEAQARLSLDAAYESLSELMIALLSCVF